MYKICSRYYCIKVEFIMYVSDNFARLDLLMIFFASEAVRISAFLMEDECFHYSECCGCHVD